MVKHLFNIGDKAFAIDIRAVGGTEVNENDARTIAFDNRMKA